MPIDVVERDYALGHVLAAVYAQPELARRLVFKGGTALKKAYFGDYRFSVDLDFTADDGPRDAELEVLLEAAASAAQTRLAEAGPLSVRLDRRPERAPHPGGQKAFRLLVRFPWQTTPLCSIKLEITMDEPLALPPERRRLLHGYEEDLAATLLCYSLEEIVAEKLRTLLQVRARIEQGRWARDCARDYYDLWRIVADPRVALDRQAVARILPEKCDVRMVSFRSASDFVDPRVVSQAERQWQSILATLIRTLPPFDEMMAALEPRLEGLVRRTSPA